MKFFLLFATQLLLLNCFAQLQPVSSGVYKWAISPVKKNKDRESRKIAEGTTPEFEFFEIHATTQYKDAIAKPAHAQADKEELIIIKEGSLKCTIGDYSTTLDRGGVLLIPPGEMQLFENAGDGPVTYYVFMFRSKKPMDIERSKQAGGALLIKSDTLVYKTANNKGSENYFNRPTAMTENFEMHTTYLKQKGPSHAPHQHVDTEIILMVEGETEMVIDGKTYKAVPGDLFIAVSGSLHGISNTTDKPCSYFAFKWR